MVADNVLVFAGNGAICSNSKMSLLDGSAMKNLFNDVDYLGAPTSVLRGIGGQGDISYRNRTAMLDAIHYEPHDGESSEDQYFIRNLKKMNEKAGRDVYRIATKELTREFAGMDYFTERRGPPMVISGTLPKIDYDVRNLLLEVCPEIKVLFPSLHSPGCFGARPNANVCAEHICALNPPKGSTKYSC